MKITIIIPVYNKAPFLRRCFDELEAQIKDNVEVIIVDDCSTDGGGEICDEYGEKNKWLVIHHAINKGVSEARNIGLINAKGDFITFLDADDVLLPGAINAMLYLTERDFNICQFGHQRARNFEIHNNKIYESPKGIYDLSFIPKYWVMVWNKLYKASFLKKNKIKFKKGMQFGEDTLFNAECILANGGLYHAPQATVLHCVDDNNSLCRGDLKLKQLELLDKELNKLYEKQTIPSHARWAKTAIKEHRESRLFNKMGFGKEKPIGDCDIVYFVKNEPENDELRYSLRSVEQNFKYNKIWFCGGCPEGIKPDRQIEVRQNEFSKWDRVRNMLEKVCRNEEITENFWLFNDDFFILKSTKNDYTPRYNGELCAYIKYTESKNNSVADGFTIRLRQAYEDLKKAGLSTWNYEVHKPMLINRKKALKILEKFKDTPCFRSIYGNYYKIGGINEHDCKIKVLDYKRILAVAALWNYVSTDDESFKNGNIGELLREKFEKKSKFEA